MKRKFLAIAVLVFLLCAVIIFSYIGIRRNIDRPVDASNTQAVAFEIKQGQSVKEISGQLEKDKLITGSDFFRIYLWQNNLGSRLKAGTYEISPSMTIAQIVKIFTGGEIGLKSNETRVIVTEGFSNSEIFDALKKADAISGDESFDDVSIDFSKYDFLADKPATSGLQGYLFPDTYNFFKGSALEDVTEKMLDNFDKKLTPSMRMEIKRQGKSVYDVLILASIVEKEAGNKEEMPTIAGIFYNRLEIGQPLQSDATVNYVTKAGRAMPTGDDLAVDSPFNTYKYKDLPPEPICNPGIEAIKAAIYPEKTDYLYFLTTQDGEKNTYFSKTYAEHLQNKAKYLSN
jgi:UPF0755 protein